MAVRNHEQIGTSHSTNKKTNKITLCVVFKTNNYLRTRSNEEPGNNANNGAKRDYLDLN